MWKAELPSGNGATCYPCLTRRHDLKLHLLPLAMLQAYSAGVREHCQPPVRAGLSYFSPSAPRLDWYRIAEQELTATDALRIPLALGTTAPPTAWAVAPLTPAPLSYRCDARRIEDASQAASVKRPGRRRFLVGGGAALHARARRCRARTGISCDEPCSAGLTPPPAYAIH